MIPRNMCSGIGVNESMIPKVIHCCWFGGNPIPRDVKKCINSWKTMCPDYEIKIWDETNFDVNEHPFTKAAYEAKAWAFVSDYARLKVVYDNGGIYLDTDVELLKNLDFLLKNQCYIGIQQAESLCTTGLGFGATKSNPVVLKMLSAYDSLKFDLNNKNKIACPYLNDKVIRSFGDIDNNKISCLNEVTVYPSEYFDPYGGEDLLCDDTISIHHYSASWTSGKQKLKRKIARMIGTGNSIKLKKILRR